MNSNNTLEEVAYQFGVSERAIKGKASAGKWAERRRGQNVIPIADKEPRAAKRRSLDSDALPRIPRPKRRTEEISELEIIENAIVNLDSLFNAICEIGDLRGVGGAAGALCKLVELRMKLKPKTAAELAEMAIELGITPTEFAFQLREKWQLRA